MTDLKRLVEVATEATQEARRIGTANEPRFVKIRLKKSDPRVQDLVKLVTDLADTVLIGDITVVREKLPGAEAAVLDALRACGVPIDEFMPQIKPGFSPTPSAILTGLGFLKTFLPVVDPKLADGIRRVEEALLGEAECKR